MQMLAGWHKSTKWFHFPKLGSETAGDLKFENIFEFQIDEPRWLFFFFRYTPPPKNSSVYITTSLCLYCLFS